MRLILALWGMARPVIMVSVLLVYALGLLLARADGYALPTPALLWGGVALLLVSLSIHYTNEYADHETDALTTPTPYSGGSGVLPRGLVAPVVALQAAWVTLILGLAVAFAGVWVGTLPSVTVPVLVIGAVFGWFYSLPPPRLAWRGYGELDNALLGGVLLPLYGYATVSGTVAVPVIALCVPFALLAFLNLLATTWADRHADAQVGKRTLATRWRVPTLRRLYATLALSYAALVAALTATQVMPLAVTLAHALVTPLIVWGYHHYTRHDSPHPSVWAMVALLAAQMTAWVWVL